LCVFPLSLFACFLMTWCSGGVEAPGSIYANRSSDMRKLWQDRACRSGIKER
jgi:hypothetical protein